MVFGACQIPLTTFSCILHLTLFRPLEEETALGIFLFFFADGKRERERQKKKRKLQPEFAFHQYDVMIVTQSLPLVAIKITIMQ